MLGTGYSTYPSPDSSRDPSRVLPVEVMEVMEVRDVILVVTASEGHQHMPKKNGSDKKYHCHGCNCLGSDFVHFIFQPSTAWPLPLEAWQN